MSTLEERPLDKLADMVINVLWQKPLEVWQAIRSKMESEGPEAVKLAFEESVKRFVSGPFEPHLEVRWGMNLCVHCNDDNVEKNGIAYVQPNGDGLEFNQCLNCRIGILYQLHTATAKLDTYNIALGRPGQFNGYSIFWNAIVPEDMKKFIPSYELIQDGQWVGTISFDGDMSMRFLPFESMTTDTPRGSEDPWTTELPGMVRAAMESFLATARYQVEAALCLK
jgi:hypothetical protein